MLSAVTGPTRWEIEVDTGEQQEQQAAGVDPETPPAQTVAGAVNGGVAARGEIQEQPHEQGHGVAEVEPECRDADDRAEALVAREVDAVQRHLHSRAQQDRVDGHVGAFVHGAEQAGEREAAVACECVQGVGAFGHEAVGAYEHDYCDHGGQPGRGPDAAGAVVEDLDQWHAGAGAEFFEMPAECYIACCCDKRDQVGHKHGVPALDDVVGVVEVGHAEHEICADEVVGGAHGDDAGQHEPACHVA